MRMNVLVAILMAASVLLTAAADAAPLRKKRKVPNHWHGPFGYLPGFGNADRLAREEEQWRAEHRGPYYLYGGPGYGSSFSQPGFFRGRWNGGGFGPCWSRTPIGMIWNCG